MKTKTQNHYLRLFSSIEGAQAIKDSASFVKILESSARGSEGVDLIVGVPKGRMATFSAIVDKHGIDVVAWEPGQTIEDIRTAKSSQNASTGQPEAKEPTFHPSPGVGVRARNPNAHKFREILTAFGLVAEVFDPRGCDCDVCTSLNTLLEFVAERLVR